MSIARSPSLLSLMVSLSACLVFGCGTDAATGIGGTNNSGSGASSASNTGGGGNGTGAASTGGNSVGGSGLGGSAAGGGGQGGTSAGGGGQGGGLGGGGTAGVSVGGGGAGGVSTSTNVGGSGGHPITPCKGHVYECGDGVDNDGDGLIDSDDPDCLGPCQDSESHFGGIPGANNAPCKADCFWDLDSGPGNDDCYWDHRCDPNEVDPGWYPEHEHGSACAYDPNANISGTTQTCAQLLVAQSATCGAVCGPLTPNGCDCFGCCNLPSGSTNYVYVGSQDAGGNYDCDINSVNDPTICQPCLPVAGCLNTCEHCEICIGKPTLPADCLGGTGGAGGAGGAGVGGAGGAGVGGGGGSGQCPSGIQACGQAGQDPCPTEYYCITGCCQLLP